MLRNLALILAVTLLSACATGPVIEQRIPKIGPDATARECELLYDHMQEIIKKNAVRDGQAQPVKGFLYLRADRFLASFKDRLLEDQAYITWLDYLQKTGKQGLFVELSNLDRTIRDTLPTDNIIHVCTLRLRRRDFGADKAPDKNVLKKLIAAIDVPGEYETWKRAVGLYWLTAWGVKSSTKHLHEEIKETYNNGLQAGHRIKYVPPYQDPSSDPDDITGIMERAYKNNSLGIPQLSARDSDRLFTTFAPTIVVDTNTDADRIGFPTWTGNKTIPTVDTTMPRIYRHVSYTRFQEKILLQLNYVFWFPARPKISRNDYLGGHMDGVTWRVTLSPDGAPLAYDSMHNCGCYHLFFPADPTCMNDSASALQEPAFSYQSITNWIGTGTRLSLYISRTSHYLERVLAEPAREVSDPETRIREYQWAEYDSLRSITGEDGIRKSLFQENGIVKGTQRAERFFLWPMGIPGPGEMRQWSHHATAFFGRRHFDDPDLIERSFRLKTDGMCQ